MLGTSPVVWAALAASLCRASPIDSAPLVRAVSDHGDLFVHRAADVPSTSMVKREDVSFDLTKSYNNTKLFDGSYSTSSDGVTESVSLALTCVECSLAGTVTASVTDASDPTLRLDFAGVEGYFDFGLAVSDKVSYTYTIYSTETPVGVSFSSGVVDISLGIVLYIDLVFSLSAEVDLEGGFTVQIADGSYLEADIKGSSVSNSVFSGTSVGAIPVTLKSGEATFQADLRLRAECGAEADVLGLGVDAEFGLYVDLLEFIVEAETSDVCDVLLIETWDINAGAYIDLDVVINYSSFGAVPTASTTLVFGATSSQCLGASATATTTATATAYAAALAALAASDSATVTAMAAATSASSANVAGVVAVDIGYISSLASASVGYATTSATVVRPTGYAVASGGSSYSHSFNGTVSSAHTMSSATGSTSVSGVVLDAVSGAVSTSGALTVSVASSSAAVSTSTVTTSTIIGCNAVYQ